MGASAQTGTITTQVPARLDRLPWSRFHWRVVIGLGGVWVLDGLEVTMVGNVSARLTEKGSGIDLNPAQIGVAAAIYITGACLGALFFGHLTDRFGRRNLFMLTLAVYLVSTVATAFAFAPWYFFVTRFFTGAGIGGEYAAINSAIDELIPARVRGRVDLIINGTYWLGSAAGAAGALFVLDTSHFPANIGWRLAFGIGAIFGIFVLLVRRNVPESPRWLFIHGRDEEAERIVREIEEAVESETGQPLPEPHGPPLKIRQRHAISFLEIAKVAFVRYPRRAVLGLALFIGQAFLYNGVTFNLGTLLSEFYGRPMFLRAGVILPRDFAREPERKYPLRVHIGGYGGRFTGVLGRMREGSPFRKAWLADDAPKMILLALDGAGPLGDPYQVNSANHGPYGDAITKEIAQGGGQRDHTRGRATGSRKMRAKLLSRPVSGLSTSRKSKSAPSSKVMPTQCPSGGLRVPMIASTRWLTFTT